MLKANETLYFDDQTRIEIQTATSLQLHIKNETLIFSEDNKQVFDNQRGEKVVEYYGLTEDDNAIRSFAKASLEPGGSSQPHYHHHVIEDYYILCGKGDVYIDGVKHQVSAGDYIQIATGTVHQIFNSGNQTLEIFVACTPAWRVEDFNPAPPHLDQVCIQNP